MSSLRIVRLALVALTLSSIAHAAPFGRAFTAPGLARSGPRGVADVRAGWGGLPRARAGWGAFPGLTTARRPAPTSRLSQSALAALPPGHGAVAGIPDGAGGTYVAWEDFRDGVSDIYLLRVTNAGAVAGGWPASGVAVCNAPGAQTGPVMVSDGANGVILVWQDLRNGFFSGEGFAQRVTAAGATSWTANGVKIVGGGIPEFPSIAPDGSGGLLITWEAGSPADIYALRVNSAGAVPAGWNASGSLVCSAVDEQLNPVIANDNTGGAIVAWEDFRDGSGDSHIFAQRLNSSAVAQWTADGLQIDATTQANDPCIQPDGAGGAVLCWWDFDLTGMIRGQRVNSAGAAQWGAGTNMSGVIFSGDQVEAMSDGAGGMIAYWLSSDLVGGTALLGQHVNAAGANQWGASAPSVASFSATEYMDGVDAASDGAGGAVFTWMRGGFSQTGEDMLAQKIASNGSASWTAGGVTVKSNVSISQIPRIAPDGSGGAVLAWIESDDNLQFVTVKAQRYNSGGTAQLAAGGVNVWDDPGIQLGGGAISDGGGGAWTVWTEKTAIGNTDVKARHLTSGGASPGPTIAITTAGGDQLLAGAISDGAGGVIVAWRDRSGADDNISAQRLDAAGSAQWGPSGLSVCNAVRDQALTSMASDGAGGAIFTWWDERNESSDGNVDIFAQRVTSAGAAQWGANGLGVCTNTSFQTAPVAVPVSGNGAMILWTDYRNQPAVEVFGQVVNGVGAVQLAANGIAFTTLGNFSNFDAAVTDGANGAILATSRIVVNFTTGLIDSTEFRALRFNGSGAAQWGAGVVAYHQPTYALFPQMVADGTGGALLAWGDLRSGTSDIYVQRITSAGAQSYGLGGAVACNAASWQWPSGLFATGSGDATVSWWDERAGLGDIYAQRIANTGTPAWTANGVLVCGAARGQYGVGGTPDNASGGVFAWTDYRSGTARYIYAQRLNNLGVPQWPADGVVDVLISLAGSSASPDRVAIDWQVSGIDGATLYRTLDGASWEVRGRIVPDASGRIAYQDRDVTAGARYGYRLGVIQDGTEVFGGEVWVDVPLAFALRLRGFTPNPASGPLRVSFTLATRAPAQLEMLDVAGRVVFSRDLAGFEPGENQVVVNRTVSPGVYFLRLHQGTQQITMRAVAMR